MRSFLTSQELDTSHDTSPREAFGEGFIRDAFGWVAEVLERKIALEIGNWGNLSNQARSLPERVPCLRGGGLNRGCDALNGSYFAF